MTAGARTGPERDDFLGADCAGQHRLAGRDHELRVLASALTSAEDGGGRLVVVEGEPGIGKTALLEAAAALGRKRGFRVLRARRAVLE